MSTPNPALLADYLDIEMFAAEVGRHIRTVQRWMNKPDGLPFTKLGGRILIRRESALKWIAAQERQSNPRGKRARRHQRTLEATAA